MFLAAHQGMKLGHICMTEILFPFLHILLHCQILQSYGDQNSTDFKLRHGCTFFCGYYLNVLCHASAVPLAEILFSCLLAIAMSTATEKPNSMKMDVKTFSKAWMRFTFSLSALSLGPMPGEDRSRITVLFRCS